MFVHISKHFIFAFENLQSMQNIICLYLYLEYALVALRDVFASFCDTRVNLEK